MFQAVCKNTFISFVAQDADDSIPASMLPSPKSQQRSRSAECMRDRSDAEEEHALTQQSLQRLNAVLSVGISSPVHQSQKGTPALSADFVLDQVVNSPEKCTEATACPLPTEDGLSELRTLQGKLAKALDFKAMGGNSSPLLAPKPWDKHRRVESNCSLSTMAPDDASECGEHSPSASVSGGLRRMPKVWSSGSVSTMVSDWADSIAEDDEVEFELDIEAGAEAARKESKRSCGAPFSEMTHSQVPKSCDMSQMCESSTEEAPTTMMIRNVPGRYSQNHLMMDLQDLGFHGTYDFLYIPMDKSTSANVGYAFVNFTDAAWAARCVEAFENYRFNRHQRSSTKVASVSVAHLQGLEKNMQHYEKAAVNMSRDKRRRPVVLPNIAKMFA